MTFTIYNTNGNIVGQGKNLAVLNYYAKKYLGVRSITLKFVDGKSVAKIVFPNEYYSIMNFSDYDVAVKWAIKKRLRLGTYWTGCIVHEDFSDGQ
jgi:hypothetical protein